MKKASKKICSIVLALALCMSLCCTAFAASSPETMGSITINGAIANETYTIYQIFDLTYTDYDTTDEDAYPDSYSYKVCEGWADFLETQTVNVDGNNVALFTLTEAGYLDPNSLIFDYGDDSEVVAGVARAALTYAEENNIAGISVSYTYDATTETATLNPQGVATITNISTDENDYVTGDLTFENLNLGYYLVGTSLGSLCMLDSTDPDATVEEKNSTPTISKHVYNTEDADWEQEDDENNTSTVAYELDVDHITGAVNLVVHDSQPREIEENWDNFHPSVRLIDGETVITLTENTDYVINLTGAVEDNGVDCSDPTFNGEHACTFEIDFTGYDFSNVSDEAYIEIIYTGTLNTEDDSYDGDEDEIDNFAVVTFGSSSSSPVVEAEVYSFGFEVFKYTDEYEGAYNEVIVAPFSNDNPEESVPSDELYLMLIDADGNVTFYATFEELDTSNSNYIYAITGWVTTEDEASSITEPEYGTGDQTAYFYVPKDMTIPDHARIELDEDASNPDQETNSGAEIVSATDYGQPLAGATFEVKNEAGQTAYFLEETVDGQTIYLFEGWDLEDTTYTSALTSATDGMIYIEGLDTGTYTVTEIAAPDGYNMLDSSITVTIWAEYDEASGAITDWGVTWTLDDETGDGIVTVLNNTGEKLPSTGGIGTTIFYIIGGILVVGAVVVLVTRRRMTSES